MEINGCGPRMCHADDAPFPKPFHSHGYTCAFPPEMLATMLQVFDDATVDESAYTEVVVSADQVAFEAVVHMGSGGESVHRNLIDHWKLNDRQLSVCRPQTHHPYTSWRVFGQEAKGAVSVSGGAVGCGLAVGGLEQRAHVPARAPILLDSYTMPAHSHMRQSLPDALWLI